jgi:putative NADPH-quinone reductase
MKVLVIVAHYRENSLTYELKNQFEKGLKEAGHQVDVLDLYKLKLNPILEGQDQPNRSTSEEQQHFSEQVLQEQERLLKYDSIALLYPLYWFSLPAMVKGYVDRVWNYGFAYGKNKKWDPKKVLWMPLAGSTEENFRSRTADTTTRNLLNEIAAYCKFKDSKVKMFYGTLTGNNEQVNQNLIKEAYQEGLRFELSV